MSECEYRRGVSGSDATARSTVETENSTKAAKYHDRLVAMLRRMTCMCRHPDFDEAPCSYCVERATLLAEINADR